MIKRQGELLFIYITIETYVKLPSFGDVVYHSYKMRYVHLYVDEDKDRGYF